jgi:hypothetical protein
MEGNRISLCTICMDRPLTGLKSWLSNNVFSKIIVCDWSSKVPVSDILSKEMAGSNIYVVRVLDQEKFYITKARNTAMRAMRYLESDMPEFTLMVDGDVSLLRPLQKGLFNVESFLRSPCSSPNLTGTVLFPTKAFWEVNGYFEKITYRHSDNYFLNALTRNGYMADERLDRFIKHNKHPRMLSSRVVINDKCYTDEEQIDWCKNGIMEQFSVEITFPDGSKQKMIL